MTYRQFLAQLNARGMFRIRPRLDDIRKVLSILGNPQDNYPSIHLAGTNGKGSVAAALESALRACGYRTGLYTSPHLMDVRERVKIAGVPFNRGFTQAADEVLQAEGRAKRPLTYFELLTAMAFQSFASQKVDIAIIECGLGGLWDATNVLEAPLLSIITSVGFDHMEWLGTTERQIAAQKAGIIKQGACVISGVRGSGRAVIAEKAEEAEVNLIEIDTDFKAYSLTSSWRSGTQTMSFRYRGEEPQIIPFGLLGVHQIDNAAIVMAALKELQEQGWDIPPERRDRGLRDVHWPGRLELVRLAKSAPILLDGAHNPSAMNQLRDSIAGSEFKNVPKTFVFSAFKDKAVPDLADMIASMASEVCICPLPRPRGAMVSQLRLALHRVRGPVRAFNTPREALEAALQDTPKDGLVVVTGSLALVGQILCLMPSLHSSSPIHV